MRKHSPDPSFDRCGLLDDEVVVLDPNDEPGSRLELEFSPELGGYHHATLWAHHHGADLSTCHVTRVWHIVKKCQECVSILTPLGSPALTE